MSVVFLRMKSKISDDGVFLHLDRRGNGGAVEFILNKGFSRGVCASENYHFHSSYEVHVCVKGSLHILVEDDDIYLFEKDAIILLRDMGPMESALYPQCMETHWQTAKAIPYPHVGK